MRARLVVGRGRLARDVVETLQDRAEPLYVVCEGRKQAERLESADLSVTVQRGDPTDPETLAALDDIDSVLALDTDAAVNAAVLSAVDDVFPEAFRLGYVGEDPVPEDRTAVEANADRVVDPARTTVETLTARLGEAGGRTRLLKRVLADLDGPLAIVTHDNPDPDAIASAVALGRLAGAVGCESQACYFGSISHQENRAFVNLLDIDLHNLESKEDLDQFGGVALVDHSRAGVNDQLPEDMPVDIVIDHHPPRGPVDAKYVDLRSDVGATSTLMVEYFQQFGIDIDETVATALLFGIRIDTDEFSREVSVADFEAAAELITRADLPTLQRVESPSMSPETLETIADAISNRAQHGPALISGVGDLSNRDALAQAADRLLDMEGVTTTLVHGITNGTVFVSARARGADIDLGEALRDAFGQIGSAGGHADMAGAQIELGVMDAVEADNESLAEIVDQIITDRFLDVLEAKWNRSVRPYPGEEYFVTQESADDSLTLLEGDRSGE